MLYDITAYPARVLAHRWGVPIVQLSPNLVAWEGYEEEVGKPLFEPLKRTPRGQAFYETFAGWIAENGMDLSVEDFMGRPDRCLVLIPRALQPNADRVDERRYTFVGACQGDRGAQGEWQRPAGAGRVLLVSLGSSFTKQPAFYRACAEAFEDLPDWHVVLQIGKFVDPAELGELPGNVEVHSWVPQLAVLRQADAFITHAGAGGSQEGLATGTPMVAVPQAVDQFGNADMLQTLGVARHLPMEEATAAALREAVLAVADDPEVARRLREIRERMTEEEAPGGPPTSSRRNCARGREPRAKGPSAPSPKGGGRRALRDRQARRTRCRSGRWFRWPATPRPARPRSSPAPGPRRLRTTRRA